MTTPKLDTPQEVFHWISRLRGSLTLTDNQWLDIVADYIIEVDDDFHAEVSKLLVEAYGDLFVGRG